MPYGIDKKIGGDSKENVTWMERCVKSIKKQNPSYSEQKAIRICKTQLVKNKNKEK